MITNLRMELFQALVLTLLLLLILTLSHLLAPVEAQLGEVEAVAAGEGGHRHGPGVPAVQEACNDDNDDDDNDDDDNYDVDVDDAHDAAYADDGDADDKQGWAETSQEADLQSWPLLHLRTAARTQPAWTQYLHKEDNDDISIIMNMICDL